MQFSELAELDQVLLADGRQGKLLHFYKGRRAAAVEFPSGLIGDVNLSDIKRVIEDWEE